MLASGVPLLLRSAPSGLLCLAAFCCACASSLIRNRSRFVILSTGLCLIPLGPAVFAASCAALAFSIIEAKPRFAGSGPLAVEGGVGVVLAVGFGVELVTGFG